MKWSHIMDKQPSHDESIIHLEKSKVDEHLFIGMRNYYQTTSFEEYLNWRRENNLPAPDFWWMSAKDFQFPEMQLANKGKNELDKR